MTTLDPQERIYFVGIFSRETIAGRVTRRNLDQLVPRLKACVTAQTGSFVGFTTGTWDEMAEAFEYMTPELRTRIDNEPMRQQRIEV